MNARKMSGKRLLIATMNPGKVAELGEMLAELGITAVGLGAFPNVRGVEESGSTFLENARLKASNYAIQTGLPSLADDSGLEVATLGGRPGVHSARYGGDVSFPERMRLLLDELKASGSTDRRARFVCSIALASADGQIVATTEGICNGRLTDEPHGNGGFGYDPVFVPDGYEMTFGELSSAIKAQISHRKRAFSQIMPFLRPFFGVST